MAENMNETEALENMLYEGMDKKLKSHIKFGFTDEASRIVCDIVENDASDFNKMLVEEQDDEVRVLMCDYLTLCDKAMKSVNHYYVGFDRVRDCQIIALDDERHLITEKDIKQLDELTGLDKKVGTAICALHNMGNTYIFLDTICLAAGLNPCFKEVSKLAEEACRKLFFVTVATPEEETYRSKKGLSHITAKIGHCIQAEMYTINDKTVIKLLEPPLLSRWLFMR